jgi:hypothetical protein
MKHAALAGFLALAGVGVWWMVGRDADAPAAAVKTKGGERSGAAASRDPEAEESEPRDGDLANRVAVLESEVAALRRQLVGLQAARAGFAGGYDDEDDEDDQPAARPVEGFDAAVREVLAEEREREQTEEDERRAERWEQRMEERLDELVSEAGVTVPQREAIAKLWESERERTQPLMSAARRGERDFQEVRDEVDAARKETDNAVAKLIDDKQLERYTEMRSRGGRDRGPRGDQGPRGGDQ